MPELRYASHNFIGSAPVSGRTTALALAKSHDLQNFSNVGLPSSGSGVRREGACPTPLCMYRSSFQISRVCRHFLSLTLSEASALILIDSLRDRNIPNVITLPRTRPS
jgi:hypothetical protein